MRSINPVTRKLTIRSLTLALVLSFLSPQGHAEAGDIEWNGFLNVVGGLLLHDPVKDFTDAKQYPSYQGYENKLTFDPQSSAGIQAQKRLDEQSSVTMQLYAEGDIDHYEANLKWLYLTYTPTYHSTFRIGRIGTPVYYFSDYLNIGYTYHWVTPPEPVYPFDTTITGVDYVYQNAWKDIEWSAEFLGGADDEYLPLIETRVITRNAFCSVFSASKSDWLSFRAMFYRADSSFFMDVLTDERLDSTLDTEIEKALVSFGFDQSQIDALKPNLLVESRAKVDNGDLNLDDFVVSYGDIALRAETERWLLMTELSTIKTDTYLFNDVIARYLTAGYRVGPIMYHITLAEGKAVPHQDARADARYTLPENPQPSDYTDLLASRLKSTIAGSLARSLESVSIGLRFETSSNTAVKFEITHFEEKSIFDDDTYAVGSNTLFRTALNATF